MPEKNFVPADNENMHEWQVEGRFEIDAKEGDHEAYFSYQYIDGEYELQLRAEDSIGKPDAVIKGLDGEDSYSMDTQNPAFRSISEDISRLLPLPQLSYWLRGLPASSNAMVKKNGDNRVEAIDEQGWAIEYDNHMQVDPYLLPQSLTMENENAFVEIEMVRAETGYLTSPCPEMEYSDPSQSQVADADNDAKKVLETLVPRDGSAPLPRWINKGDFCRQLVKVHGKIPDPRIGLYGPDSMMWKLSGPLAPGGMGAGRALLLQTAHPWITAGIDEHSIVRYDPIERARRTAVNILTMVYGSMPQVMKSANKVHATHEEIKGKIPYRAGAFHRGSEYRANEINAMIWVHATLWETLATMYEKLVEPLTQAEKDQFYEETKLFAMLFGIPESALPNTWDDFMAYNHAMWNSPQLTVTKNARALKEDLFTPRSIFLIFPLWIQEVVTAAHLPPKIREGYGLEYDTWEQFNNAWLMASAKLTQWMLPDMFGETAIKHEAEARLRGERVNAYHRMIIESFLGTETLVN